MVELFTEKALRATTAMGYSSDEVLPLLRNLLEIYDNNCALLEENNYSALIEAYYEHKNEKKTEIKRDSEVQKPAKRRHMATKGEHITRKIVGSKEVPRPQTIFEGEGSASSDVHRVNSTSRPHKDESPKPSTKRSVRDLRVSGRPISASNPGLSSRTSSSEHRNTHPIVASEKGNLVDDITRGTEKIRIPLVGETGKVNIPKFMYIPQNLIYEDGKINISLARVGDAYCCFNCSGDCLSSIPCACARETGGEFAYTSDGLLQKKFLSDLLAMKMEPQDKDIFYCKPKCPLEKAKDEYLTEDCKGHLIRKFIKECWRKCGCDMNCGNRVVQRGISCKMEVFWTSEGKGWGVRPLEPLRKGTFVCEYIGEILTNNELFKRNMEVSKERHTYPVTLDGDWGSEKHMEDDNALCLDATFFGNVARFINHRCHDENLIDVPVEIETQDRHYYHLAFFTTKDVAALEELTWDYGIDFDDTTHPIKAFRCSCGSAKCRDKKSKRKKV